VLVSVREAVVPGRVRCEALDVAHDTRLLVTGPNGVGKSSLLALLAGELPPVRGRVLRARGVRVGLLAQETRWPDQTVNALSAFASGRVGDADEHVSALLDVGLLHPRELRTPVGRLSVGQQRRVALARLLVDDPDVLLLDEPTDHLSLALVEELEEALRRRPGPLVVVSHDRWLRRRWEGDVLAMVPPGESGGR
jgi:macrolide transport system ATP-binding/permease protein